MGVLALIAAVLMMVAVVGCLVAVMGPTNSPYLSEGNEPEPDCEDCKGTGIINADDEFQKMDCPCTDRWYY